MRGTILAALWGGKGAGRVAASISNALSAADPPEHVRANAIGSFRLSVRELPEDLPATARVVVVDQCAAADRGQSTFGTARSAKCR